MGFPIPPASVKRYWGPAETRPHQADRRRTTIALYRIECIIDELVGKDFNRVKVARGRIGRFMYIHTGTDHAKKLRGDLFAAETASTAIHIARKREWTQIRLYQCDEIPLT